MAAAAGMKIQAAGRPPQLSFSQLSQKGRHKYSVYEDVCVRDYV